jgi:ectoine hydroxylase-related dioxygenase (phytanoyl-CoA dioxygenase family)
MSTSPAEITEFFQKNGYYLAKGVYSPAEVAELEPAFDRIVDQLSSSGENINARWGGAEAERIGNKDAVVVHTHNVQMYSAVWLRAFLQNRFLDVSRAILGPDVILHHSKLFQKPAEKGAPFPMHQDWSYFPTLKDTMMAGIIHVSNATDQMGCLRVYPGSHRLGRKAESGGMAEGEDGFLKDYPIEKALVVEAEPGDVLFFNYCTLHGSMPNRSQKVRKTVLVQLHSGSDTVEDGNAHPNARLVLSGWNHYAKRSLGNQ